MSTPAIGTPAIATATAPLRARLKYLAASPRARVLFPELPALVDELTCLLNAIDADRREFIVLRELVATLHRATFGVPDDG